MRNPALASVLRDMADKGVAEGFYRGVIRPYTPDMCVYARKKKKCLFQNEYLLCC